jgi:hypothetical protein
MFLLANLWLWDNVGPFSSVPESMNHDFVVSLVPDYRTEDKVLCSPEKMTVSWVFGTVTEIR